MAEIRLERVTKRYGNVVAVRDMHLDIQDREFVVFLGPSGCGKTTTLRSIAGLEHPEEGQIQIGGRVVNGLPPAERDIAFVFQFYALYPHLTAYENIAFPLKAVKVPKSEIQERVREVAQILRIDERLLNRKPSQLSGGEMQRVALGRAMVRRPKAYLMDEPMANLDAKLRTNMRFELKRLQRELGTTTVFVTHDQIEAMSMADRIAVMNHGALQQIGTPEQVYHQPESLFVAGFMGSPSMNLMAGEPRSANGQPHFQLSRTNLSIPLNDEHWRRITEKATGREIVFGIRPEHVLVSKSPLANGVKARVHLVEALGFANIIDLQLGEDEQALLRTRTHPAFSVGVGQPVWWHFDSKHLHFFDQQTERAIR